MPLSRSPWRIAAAHAVSSSRSIDCSCYSSPPHLVVTSSSPSAPGSVRDLERHPRPRGVACVSCPCATRTTPQGRCELASRTLTVPRHRRASDRIARGSCGRSGTTSPRSPPRVSSCCDGGGSLLDEPASAAPEGATASPVRCPCCRIAPSSRRAILLGGWHRASASGHVDPLPSGARPGFDRMSVDVDRVPVCRAPHSRNRAGQSSPEGCRPRPRRPTLSWAASQLDRLTTPCVCPKADAHRLSVTRALLVVAESGAPNTQWMSRSP